MKKDYHIRLYQPGDEEEIVQLLELVFHGWPPFDLSCTPLDHWRWKYLDNPLKMNTIIVGVANNKIISCDHAGYLKIKIGKKTLLCFQGMDSAVHPDYRRMGVYTKMEEKKLKSCKNDKIDLCYWSTATPIFIKSGIKKGDPRFPVSGLIRIHDVDLHVKNRSADDGWLVKTKRAYGYRSIKALNSIRNVFTRPPASKSDLSIEEIEAFNHRIEALWDEIRDHYSFIIDRNLEYLNWRYCDSRGGDYIIKQAEEDGVILGYSVFRINRHREEYPQGCVVDLLVHPNRLDAADALIGDAVRIFDGLFVNIIHYWVIENHPYEWLFKRHGFFNSRTNLHVFYRPLNVRSELDEFRNTPSKQLHLQYGDTDGI